MSLPLTVPQTDNALLEAIYAVLSNQSGESILKIQLVDAASLDRSGVCGGCKAVTPGATAFDYPSFIECQGADGTITGEDEYGNTVTTYPMTVGKITPFRMNKVTAVSAGVTAWRIYAV